MSTVGDWPIYNMGVSVYSMVELLMGLLQSTPATKTTHSPERSNGGVAMAVSGVALLRNVSVSHLQRNNAPPWLIDTSMNNFSLS